MSGKKSAIAKKAIDWLLHADEDLRLAKHAFKLKTSTPFKLIAYHAQQCAEKCLKAYLVFKGVDFPFTHNISALLELCPPSEEWVKELDDAKALSAYAITARYPGTYKVTKKDARQAVEIAERVRATLRKALKEEGLKMVPSRRS
jgi:HEPN domain-containing protein